MDHSEVKHLPQVDHTPADLDNDSRILLKAAYLIESNGLAKFERCNGLGYCVIGAIGFAASGDSDDDYQPAIQRMVRGVGVADWWKLADWNNDDERTPEEVVAKLRAVALSA